MSRRVHPTRLFFASLWLLLVPALHAAPPAEIVVASYNVRNYVGETVPVPGERAPARPKSERSKAVLIRIIRELKPDVLGLCEMGDPAQLTDLQNRLRAAGLELPYAEHVPGSDATRHLALLSRYPIIARNSQPELGYVLAGAPRRLERGLLDVTVQVNAAYQLRLVGVHLKSKLATADGSDIIRRHESARLRQYLEGVLAAAPDTNLLLFGDFNETRDQPAIRELLDRRGAPFLDDLAGEDTHGDRWTHYYPAADSYARIDYLFASPGLWPELRNRKAHLPREPDWLEASDHRPIYVHLRPQEKSPSAPKP